MGVDELTEGRRPGATAPHAVALYESDAGLAQRVLPFLRAGLAGEETVLAVVSNHAASLLRGHLGDHRHDVQWQVPGVHYHSLGPMFDSLRRRLGELREAGHRVRLLAENDTPAGRGRTAAYLRFEAVSNDVVGELGVTWVCLYDRRRYPAQVLDQVLQVHPQLLDPNGVSTPSTGYVPPDAYLEAHPGPLSTVPPQVLLDRPLDDAEQLAQIRHDAVQAAHSLGLPTDDGYDFELAAGEIMSNAIRHGWPPRRVRVWSTDGHVVLRVDDHGSGDDLPTKGFRPPDPAKARPGGLGVWIARQLADAVHVGKGPDGTAVEIQFPRLTHVQ
jgi:anti-sigma regulatory factor (Ser/Thr protein kinase)